MNELDEQILRELNNKINFKEFVIASYQDKIRETKKELKELKTIKENFEKTGILYC